VVLLSYLSLDSGDRVPGRVLAWAAAAEPGGSPADLADEDGLIVLGDVPCAAGVGERERIEWASPERPLGSESA
jgi:hypothetical protein